MNEIDTPQADIYLAQRLQVVTETVVVCLIYTRCCIAADVCARGALRVAFDVDRSIQPAAPLCATTTLA
eukprot:3020364-Prymnesium_polylepis.1